MSITPVMESFIMHFGEMGSRWGINRTVGQIYALLYLSAEPLNAEDISEQLGFSRSNVSMSIKELDSWGLIKRKHLPNDRRDYFTTLGDEWEIFRVLIEERRRREVEPTKTFLRNTLMSTNAHNAEDNQDHYALTRMQNMHDLIEEVTEFYTLLQDFDTKRLKRLFKMGKRAGKLYMVKDKYI